jgi:N-acetyl-alpha-D-muramate 1-phosphate uridylyltransferase
MPDGPFSLNRLWDRQIAAGRAFGIVHQGRWCDVGNPAGIVEAEAMLKDAHVS